MAFVATCDQSWTVGAWGGLICPGSVTVVDEGQYQNMPALTYEEANQVIAAALFVFALAFVIRRVLKLLR